MVTLELPIIDSTMIEWGHRRRIYITNSNLLERRLSCLYFCTLKLYCCIRLKIRIMSKINLKKYKDGRATRYILKSSILSLWRTSQQLCLSWIDYYSSRDVCLTFDAIFILLFFVFHIPFLFKKNIPVDFPLKFFHLFLQRQPKRTLGIIV